jgi:hypothetical protein
MKRDIEFCVTKMSSKLVPTDAYELVPGKGFSGWLARRFWWGLRKLGALSPYSERVVTARYTQDNAATVAKALIGYMQRNGFGNVDPREMVWIMGDKEFSELANTEPNDRYLSIQAGPIGFGSERKAFDIPVTVVPGLTGYAAIPKRYLTAH